MCSLSEGLIQAGRDEMAPVIAAVQAQVAAAQLREAEAQARADDLARIAHALISHPGWSVDDICRYLDMPVERVRALLS